METAKEYFTRVPRFASFTIKENGWNISKDGQVIDSSLSFCYIKADDKVFKVNNRNVYFK